MKKIIVLVFVVVGLVGGYFFQSNVRTATSESGETVSISSDLTPTPEVEAIVGDPVRISVPTLGVEAEVEYVEEDAEGRMDVPADVYNTAWYGLGVRPGEAGNSVIAGHYDTPTGEPSVFFALSTMSEGDEIIVEDEMGTELVFEVMDVVTYPTEGFPVKTVFGKNDRAMLNLITCGGVWNSEARDYMERTVVFSELVEPV